MITGIILASGFSKRMGQDKLLMEFKGETMIETTIKAAKNSKLDRVIIVYRKNDIKKLAKLYNVKTVLNKRAQFGQSESIKVGIKNISEKSDFMFIMGDQPFMDSDLIDFLISKYKKSSKGMLVPYYDSKRGMPSIMSSKYRDELLELSGDKGGRELLSKYKNDVKSVYLKDRKLGIDVDTLEDIERIKKWI